MGSALARTLIRQIFQSRRGSRAGGVGHQRADHKELKWPECNKIGDSFQHSLSASLEIGKDKYINLINTQLKIFLNQNLIRVFKPRVCRTCMYPSTTNDQKNIIFLVHISLSSWTLGLALTTSIEIVSLVFRSLLSGQALHQLSDSSPRRKISNCLKSHKSFFPFIYLHQSV